MKTKELDYTYTDDLVATKPCANPRVLLTSPNLGEISFEQISNVFESGDCIVLNESGVLKRRIFSFEQKEILFLKSLNEDATLWEVLLISHNLKIGTQLQLPQGVTASLIAKGLPQQLLLSNPIDENYFSTYGEFPLPPYIQRMRNERHQMHEDNHWYQNPWFQTQSQSQLQSQVKKGSFAAPTASLHFNTDKHFKQWQAHGVDIAYLTLHIGLGTFLPVITEDLDKHVMHNEWIVFPKESVTKILKAKANGKRVWALGTTAVRALESVAHGLVPKNAQGNFEGWTNLFIQPGFEFLWTTGLLTNFHQPCSTLLAMVYAFAGQQKTIEAYQWAIEKKFRLFSYGDLTIWKK